MFFRCIFCVSLLGLNSVQPAAGQIALNARPIEALPADPAAEMVAGMHRFLDRQIRDLGDTRAEFWRGPSAIDANRKTLASQLGLELRRHQQDSLIVESPPLTTLGEVTVSRVRWPVLSHPAPQLANVATLWAEGLFVHRNESRPLLVLIPDASESPEDYLRDDVLSLGQAANVLILETVSYKVHRHRGVDLTRRDYVHRAAFELGRTLTGYEVQMVQSAIDRIDASQVVVCGFGEGGRTALLAGALDQRVDWTLVGGYFENRDRLAEEPLNRQLFGFSRRFSDAHLAALVCPRGLVVFHDGPFSVSVNGRGAAPAKWTSPSPEESRSEFELFQGLSKRLSLDTSRSYRVSRFTDAISLAIAGDRGRNQVEIKVDASIIALASERESRLLASIDAHNQALLAESDYERATFLNLGHSRTVEETDSNRLDTSSEDTYRKSIERFRRIFRDEVIGHYDETRLPLNARCVKTHAGKAWTSYGIVLDVFPEVFAYGELLVPDNIAPDEKRAVVVCQHGLEGRPGDTMLGDHRAYHDYAAKLAQEGYIVFAPQNPYIGKDDFRSLQRKSYPLGKTLFSLIAAQHQQILNWLKTLPNVDANRIAFYGLSYGGKSAMRLPALLEDYCLSICSADFNDWVWKNASSRSRYSYVGTPEYEIFEFGLGRTFNYAEMAALIAPRPFMVERGHFDGVAPDDRVAKEFAKVRYLYQARLKLAGHCEIEWFDGPHTIHGQGTFEFLRRHLGKP
ncbi:MAG: alpha/beta hydrolase family protein [Planctomycetota bacterium]